MPAEASIGDGFRLRQLERRHLELGRSKSRHSMRRVERNKSRYHAAPVSIRITASSAPPVGLFTSPGPAITEKISPYSNEYAVGADDDRLVPDDEFRLQNRTENFGNCLGRWTDY